MVSPENSDPIRVLYLLDHGEPGGGETSFLALIEAALADPRPRVAPSVVVREEGPVAASLRRIGVAVEVIDYPMRLRRGLVPVSGRAAVARLGDAITRAGARLVHANNFFGLAWGGRAARRAGLPVVWTCHGWWELDNAPKRWLARRLADRVVCVSEAVRLEAERALGTAVPTATDYLGIVPFANAESVMRNAELRSEVRRDLAIAEAAPLIAVVGRFQPIKGHALLLDALPRLLDAHPDLQVLFIGDAILGDPTDAVEKRRLETRVREAGWGEAVRFLGWRDDARRLMRGLDALVIPSARESFCMVAVEGLEAGVPVVGPDGWGPAEIIDVPATGRRFRPGDADDLAVQILAVLQPGGGAGFDPAAGPRRVEAHFSARAHLDRTLAVYRDVLPGG